MNVAFEGFGFDFDAIISALIHILIVILKIPMQIWGFVPYWAKVIMLILIIILSVVLIILAYKNRFEWMKVKI